MPKHINFADIIGPHPSAPHPLGIHLSATDEHSAYGVPHRVLSNISQNPAPFTLAMREWLIMHHASHESLERDRNRREALSRQGLLDPTRRFPTNPNTQKGNWAEILLAEYLAITGKSKVPVYRLRYNPNIEQSMKGDDVLAFDLDSKPVRILVGEAKFRETPSKQVVEDIIKALTKSQRLGVPASLQFVADRLFSEGFKELGEKVNNCSLLFAQGQIQIEHVGLLVSNANTALHMRRNANADTHRLVVMSLGFSDPNEIISSCYQDIEGLS